jgi:hypothetical protein
MAASSGDLNCAFHMLLTVNLGEVIITFGRNEARLTIKTFDDFNEELKESQVLTICRDAGIITKNIYLGEARFEAPCGCRVWFL